MSRVQKKPKFERSDACRGALDGWERRQAHNLNKTVVGQVCTSGGRRRCSVPTGDSGGWEVGGLTARMLPRYCFIF